MYVCRHTYITYMDTYTCLFMYAYVNMYKDMHGYILCVCKYINIHILDIHMYISLYAYMLNECIHLDMYIGRHA